jgi:hypothetical protein
LVIMMDDERFFAWLDGELDASEREAVESAIAADPALAARAEAHLAMHARLKSAFSPILDEPVPDRVAAAARSSVVALDRTRTRPALPALAQWAAMAATLVIGLVTGTLLGERPSPLPQRAILASASLGEALDSRLASDPAAEGPRIGLTFRDKTGSICRSFTASTGQGLACREREAWAIRALMPPAEGQSGSFRMAAGPDPAIADLIDRSIDGEPFDAAQEKAGRDAGWR